MSTSDIANMLTSPSSVAAAKKTSAVNNTPYSPWVNTPATNVQNSGGNDLTNLVNSIIGGQGSIIQPNYPAGSFDVTPFKQFYDQAYQELAPYYKQLLDEAGGDLNMALTNLETGYKTGVRIKVEDFQNSMDTLGAILPKEQTALQGGLNQRGMALTENPAGQTVYAGGGLAAGEVGKLGLDQKLRTEAVQRTRQRGLETEAVTKLVGGEKQQQNYRDTTQAQQVAHENQATLRGNQYQLAEQNEKAAGIANAQANANMGNSGGSGNFMDYYKQWNPDAAKADFAAVYGNDLAKLQRSKPL